MGICKCLADLCINSICNYVCTNARAHPCGVRLAVEPPASGLGSSRRFGLSQLADLPTAPPQEWAKLAKWFRQYDIQCKQAVRHSILVRRRSPRTLRTLGCGEQRSCFVALLG